MAVLIGLDFVKIMFVCLLFFPFSEVIELFLKTGMVNIFRNV